MEETALDRLHAEYEVARKNWLYAERRFSIANAAQIDAESARRAAWNKLTVIAEAMPEELRKRIVAEQFPSLRAK